MTRLSASGWCSWHMTTWEIWGIVQEAHDRLARGRVTVRVTVRARDRHRVRVSVTVRVRVTIRVKIGT